MNTHNPLCPNPFHFSRTMLLLTLSICAVLTGCQLDTSYQQTQHAVPQALMPAQTTAARLCTLHLNEFVDQRHTKTLGQDSFSIDASMIEQWIQTGLVRAEIEPQYDYQGAALQLSLTRTYLHAVQNNLSANVVFEARYRGPNATRFSDPRLFRGQHTTTDESGETESVVNVMKGAIDSALQRIANAYRQECEGTALGSQKPVD
ncbi:hypothetical protein DXV75_09650 [Alteromonas aestuariivivens]|uniref:ABC-type transport auxiliary lipoprotein component domain-containing protein n=1 Tax=Alteromonas aestuariivivens TaxID=1938339 RepID=A0A3D8M7N3_9ALTE|nr:hypothetical protein [Alteromonas aestuariivivens]RDV25547.1 hypothetical protein DXV75_09650 [Alteromonas aestuariivivens]